MGLFDPVRGVLGGGDDEPADTDADEQEPILPPEHREPTPTNFKNMAVDAVQEWDDLDLDFSVDSLERLDSFADRQSAMLDLLRDEEGDEAASEAHTAYTVQAGSYFGEVLARSFDGKWVRHGERWAIEVPGEDDSSTVDIFEVAAHSFAEQPAFAEVAREVGPAEDGEADESNEAGTADAGADMRPEAESFAHSWSGYDLDFSANSLVRLESLAADEWDASRFRDATVGGDDMDSQMYTKLVKQLGAYYGEVLVRVLDGEWTHSGDELVVGVTGDARTTEAVFDVAAAALESDPNFVTRFRRVAQAAQCPTPEIDPDEAEASAASDGSPQPEPADTDGSTGQPRDAPPADVPPDEPADHSAEQSDDESATGGTVDQTGEGATDEQRDRAVTDRATDASASTRTGDTRPTDAPTDESTANGPDQETGDEAPTGERREPDPTVLGEPTASPNDKPRAGQSSSNAPSRDAPSGGSEPDVDAVAEELAEKADAGPGGSRVTTIDELREDAAAFAATWPGYDLDYSPESLGRLDELVSEEYETDADTDDEYLTDRAAEAGGYFAEVVHRTLGGEWAAEPTPEIVVEGRVDERRVDPVTLAVNCFEGQSSFAGEYASIQRELSLSVTDHDRS